MASNPIALQEADPDSMAETGSPVDVRAMDRTLVHGVAWTAGLKLLAQVVGWGATLGVARLLSATDYGIYGVATLALGVVQMVTEFGLGTVIVARRTLTARDFAELNTVSVLVGVAGTALTCALAPLAGVVFRQPRVVPVVLALSVTLVISSARSVPWGLLQRELAFRRLAVYDAAQQILLSLLGLALAVAGFGYWTLVVAAVGSATMTTMLTVMRHPVPFARPDLRRLRSVLEYSRDVVITRLAWYAYTNADFVVAGRMLGTVAAGYYGLAWTLAHLVVDKFAQLVFQVTPGVFGRVQHSPELVRRYFTRISAGMTLVFWPATVGIALAASDFVPAVLGARWMPILVPLQVLSAYSSVWVVLALVGQLLMIVGEEAFSRRNNLQQVAAMVVGFYVGARLGGVSGIAIGWAVVHPAFAIIRTRRLLRRIGLSATEFGRDALLPAFTGCVGMVVTVSAVRAALPAGLPPLWRLAAVVCTGSLTYVGIQATIFQRRQADALDALRGLRGGAVG